MTGPRLTEAEIEQLYAEYQASRAAPRESARPSIRVASESTTTRGPGKAPARARADIDYAKGLLRQAAQGATFGFADEAEAGVRTITGAPYRETRDSIRGANAAFAEANPGTALAANVAGGILTGGAASAAAKGTGALARASRLLAPQVAAGTSLAGRIGQAAKVGGAMGAVGGAGVAEEMGDVGRNVVTGGLVGAAGGALFAGAAEGMRGARNLASRVGQGRAEAGPIRRAVRADSPQETAVKRLLNRVQGQKMTVDDLAAQSRVADGPDVLGEVIGEKGIRDIRTTRALGYEAPDRIEESLRTRARNDVGRVRQVVRDELGDAVDDAALRPAKVAEAQKAAAPLYEQALDGVTITDPRLAEWMQRPAIRSAYATARNMAANDGVSLPPSDAIRRGARRAPGAVPDEWVGGEAVKAARTDGGGLRDVSKVSTADLLDEIDALTTRQQRDMGQSVYNFTEIEQRGGEYGVVVPTATRGKGGAPSMQAKAQRRVDQTNGVLDRMFEELDRRGVDWAEAMAQRAAGEAPELADDVARAVPGRAALTVPDAGDAPELPTLTGRQVQYIKHALDDQITKLEGLSGGTSTKRYAQLVQARQDVDGLLYEFANPGENGESLWGAANRTYAKPMQEADAFAEGVRSGRGVQPADKARLLAGEQAPWRARGVANTLQDDLARLGDGAAGPVRDPAPTLMGSDAARARLEVAAGGDLGKVRRIEETAGNASRRLRTRQIVTGGSQTADKLADQAEALLDPAELVQGAGNPLTLAMRAAGRGAKGLARNVVGQDMDAFAELLMAGAPGQMTRAEALKRVQALQPAIANLMARQALIRGGAAGTGARLGLDGR